MKSVWRILFRSLALAAVSAAWGNLSRAALPSGWSDEDIASPALAGAASYSNGLWTVAGGGTDIWNTNDQFNFAANSLTGDGALIARVISQTGTESWAQAGVMFRNDSTAASANVCLVLTPGNGVSFRYRPTAGAQSQQINVTGITPPEWVRISRSANTFTAADSSDGINWTSLGSPQTIAMSATALAGLAVTAHNNALVNTGQFTSVLIVPGPQVGVPSNLLNPYTGAKPFAGETTWPLPQLNLASNALTPRMGWNSWFVVGDAIGPSESLIKRTADALATNGLAAAGYKYVVTDCAWIASGRGYRDTNGNLIVDANRWPDGMKAVADYVHSKGLLMGGYTDIGASGYGSPAQIGAFAYYQQDADQFANWGWDFIKIDDHGPGDFYAAAHAIANNDAGRPIVLSLSTPQVDRLFFASRLANSWRVANDITGLSGAVAWSSILTEFDTAQADWYAQAPGRWNDPDMLCTGMNGISDLEGRTHFNLWCILGAPLMIGTDVTTTGGNLPPPLSAATLNTLTNAEVIAVDQDPLGAVGRPVASSTAVYAKPLGSFTSGQYAVLILNRSSQTNSFTVNWGDLGLIYGSAASVRNLWTRQNLGTFPDSYPSPNLAPHDSMMLRVTGTFDWNRPQTYEAESAYNTFSGTAGAIPENPAFSAGAYVTGVGKGSVNTLQFNQVSAPSNGLYELDIYYASSMARAAQLSVNGGPAASESFPATGGDTNQPGLIATYLQLNAGENTLLFSNATASAPNFDKIVLSRGSPSALRANAGDAQVQLAWQPSAGATSFNLYRGAASGAELATPMVAGLTNTNYTDAAVTNGQTYYYTVTAINPTLGGESPPSAEANAKPRCATSSTAYPSAVLAANPVAYWRLDEISGAIADDSTAGHNGVYGSNVTLGVAGPRPADFLGFEITNTAAQFTNNLTNSWVTIPALNLNTNALTLTAWIHPIGNQADFVGLVFYRTGTTVAGLNYGGSGSSSAGTVGYTWNNNQNTWGWNSGLMPPANQWSFVALVVQPASAVVYLFNSDGLQTATNVVSHPSQAFAGTGTIGTDTFSPLTRVFNGVMDEVAVFDYSLTSAQIRQLYANGSILPHVPLGVQTSGATFTMNWPQGTLFQATNLIGPWSRVPNALSPWLVNPTNAATFYRVLLQQ